MDELFNQTKGALFMIMPSQNNLQKKLPLMLSLILIHLWMMDLQKKNGNESGDKNIRS